MDANPSQARYYLRCGLAELDKRGGSAREHLGAVYGQWFAEAGAHMPDELRESWATIRARMTAHEGVGAHTNFQVAAARMTDVEAEALVEDIVRIMLRLGHDDDTR